MIADPQAEERAPDREELRVQAEVPCDHEDREDRQLEAVVLEVHVQNSGFVFVVSTGVPTESASVAVGFVRPRIRKALEKVCVTLTAVVLTVSMIDIVPETILFG